MTQKELRPPALGLELFLWVPAAKWPRAKNLEGMFPTREWPRSSSGLSRGHQHPEAPTDFNVPNPDIVS